jgi:ATP synthase protein I
VTREKSQTNRSSNQEETDALQALGNRVKAAQDAHNPKIDEERAGWALGIRYASEFSAAVVVGGMLGWGVDYVAKIAPWGLLAGIIIGFMAGTRNIVRAAKQMSADSSES